MKQQNVLIKFLGIWKKKHYRKKNLPNSLLMMKNILETHAINLCETSDDGRVNSSMDEDAIMRILSDVLPSYRIKKPRARMWYDFLVYDYQYGWLPVNIKTTYTLTSDNTGNLAMCVHAYTDEQLDLYKTHQNGKMSKILAEKLQKKEYNYKDKKDYYFVVVNKTSKKVIVNSVKGLTTITPNINNLPFQVCWNKNQTFKYKPITENVKMLLTALQTPPPSWKETFLNDVRKIAL